MALSSHHESHVRVCVFTLAYTRRCSIYVLIAVRLLLKADAVQMAPFVKNLEPASEVEPATRDREAKKHHLGKQSFNGGIEYY